MTIDLQTMSLKMMTIGNTLSRLATIASIARNAGAPHHAKGQMMRLIRIGLLACTALVAGIATQRSADAQTKSTFCLSNICLDDRFKVGMAKFLPATHAEYQETAVMALRQRELAQSLISERVKYLRTAFPGMSDSQIRDIAARTYFSNRDLVILDDRVLEILANYSGPICRFIEFAGYFMSEGGHQTRLESNPGIDEKSGQWVMAVTALMRRYKFMDEQEERAAIAEIQRRFSPAYFRRQTGIGWQQPTRRFAVIEQRHLEILLWLIEGGGTFTFATSERRQSGLHASNADFAKRPGCQRARFSVD